MTCSLAKQAECIVQMKTSIECKNAWEQIQFSGIRLKKRQFFLERLPLLFKRKRSWIKPDRSSSMMTGIITALMAVVFSVFWEIGTNGGCFPGIEVFFQYSQFFTRII